jgi:DNA ligase-1
VHLLEDGTCKLYSRHLEDMTERFPDVVALMQSIQNETLRSFVLDAELVAVDPTAGNRILPFQTLSTRGRKDVRAEDITVHVCCFAFDLLVLNEEVLLQKSLLERRRDLCRCFPETPGRFQFAEHAETQDEQELTAFFHQALANSCEGLMAKVLEDGSSYEPSKRSDSWLKIKRDYIESLQDSFDLVPIGAWWGNGRKAGWYSPVLLACYDPDTEELQSVCRCMSGFTDAFYQEMTAFYSQRLLDGPKSYFVTGEQPDVWFDPCEVWEIRGADLTISPVHKAAHARIDPKKGVALRFPRFIRKREDKAISDATTAAQIVDMYHLQARKVVHQEAERNGGDDRDGEDEDDILI